MKHLKPPILTAVVLTLAVSACSQLTPNAPTLEPQLGSPNTVAAVGVAFNKAGHLYALREDYTNDYPIETRNAVLSRYDRSGKLLWEREVGWWQCDNDVLYPDCGSLSSLDAATDGAGNAYSLVHTRSEGCEGTYEFLSTHVNKLSASGTHLWSKNVGNMSAFFVEPSGTFYVVGNNDTGYGHACDYEGTDTDPPYAEIVRKYGANGNLLWERALNVGTPTDVAVSGSGSVYVVGTAGMSRYSGLGSLTWTKSAPAHEVAVSASNLYTRTSTTLRRFDGTGKQLWSKGVSGLNTPTPFRIAGDTGGNLYLAGTSKTSSGGQDAFVRKYSGSGGLVWSKIFGTPKYDAALGITSYDGSEVYVAGETQGVLTEANRSGSGGYLRKMDRNGNRIWTR